VCDICELNDNKDDKILTKNLWESKSFQTKIGAGATWMISCADYLSISLVRLTCNPYMMCAREKVNGAQEHVQNCDNRPHMHPTSRQIFCEPLCMVAE